MKAKAKPGPRQNYPTQAEFNLLQARVEMLEDTVLLRAAEARGPGDDALAVEMVERLLAGESPVRVWRERRAMTAKALAAAADVDPAYLSQIETGKKPGSIKTLRSLARALAVDLDDLAGA